MRKYKLPDELAALEPAQLEEFNTWITKFTYKQVRELCVAKFGFDITDNKLCRYYQRLQGVAQFNSESAQPLTLPEYVAVQNGAPLPDDVINKQILQVQCRRLSMRSDLTPEQLLRLLNVTTYEQRSEFEARRLKIAEGWADLRRRRAALRSGAGALPPLHEEGA